MAKMLDMKYKPSQSPQAWHWPLVILRMSRVMLLGSVEQAESFLLRDSATVKKRKLSGPRSDSNSRFQKEKLFYKKCLFIFSFFSALFCNWFRLDSTETKRLLFFWCWLAQLRAVTERFLKKIISTFVDFFSFFKINSWGAERLSNAQCQIS